MDFSRRLVNHLLSSPVRLSENSLTLTSSWSTSSRLVQSMNHSKCSSTAYPFSPINCLSLWAYPLGRSCRTTGRSIGENLLSFVGVIAELWRTIKLNDEGCLSFEAVGDKDMELAYSVAVGYVEVNEASSEENGGHSLSDNDWKSIARDSNIPGHWEVW